ncbi:uncharacterized protein I206_100997 [Kwoniella pini CBS 10737]|uniref:Uncharacterized protein n=1 Tax=Kwoniella pini CBS 10737 TaxID=1296096 RepID=A0A1B9IBL1_9TREE|nr:uncharacterized protein I206_00329 [Kwoniella pini CBS 10737]OCF53028.1 hypothetical protein I206_00329 [Kwoniella pini CBS 10737]
MSSSSSSERKKAEEKLKAKKKEEEEIKRKRKEYLKKCDPSTIEELINSKEIESKWFEEGKWRPGWANVEFDEDACLKNVLKNKADGFYTPAGTILPLGAQMPEMTVLKYGGYFPEGTSFPGGVSVPMHARMVNLLPEETQSKYDPKIDESLCSVQ